MAVTTGNIDLHSLLHALLHAPSITVSCIINALSGHHECAVRIKVLPTSTNNQAKLWYVIQVWVPRRHVYICKWQQHVLHASSVLSGCQLTCRLEGAWQQADVIHAEADFRRATHALKTEAGHLVKHWDALPETVLEQDGHSMQTIVGPVLP